MTLDPEPPAAVADKARAGRWWLVGPLVLGAGILIASFLKTDLVHNDFERFADLRMTFLFFALVAAACAGYVVLWRHPPRLSAAIVVGAGIGVGALLLASFPVASKDAFLYALFGKVWATYHTNPYTTPPSAFVTDPWQPFTQVIWAEQPAPYGPLFLWQARLVDTLAAGNLFVAVWAHKAIATAALAAATVIGAHLMRTADDDRWDRIALLAWNPLLLFESAGNGHNDAVMLLLVLAAVWLHTRGGLARMVMVPAMLALAIWYKWYAILFVPAFMVAVYHDAGGAALRRWVLVTAGVLLISGVVLLAPLAEAVPLLVQRLMAHENLREIFPLQLSPPLAALLWGLEMTGHVDGRWPLMWFDVIRVGVFAFTTLVLLACQWRGKIGLLESLCALSVAFTLLVVTVLWPWHLEVSVALALIVGTPAWCGLGVFLTLLALLSYFFTYAWAGVLLVAVAVALPLARRWSNARAARTEASA